MVGCAHGSITWRDVLAEKRCVEKQRTVTQTIKRRLTRWAAAHRVLTGAYEAYALMGSADPLCNAH